MEKDESVTQTQPTIKELLEDALDYLSSAYLDLSTAQRELDDAEDLLNSIMERLEKEVNEGK